MPPTSSLLGQGLSSPGLSFLRLGSQTVGGVPFWGWGALTFRLGCSESPVEGRAPTVGLCLSVHLPIPVSMGTRAKVGRVTAGCTHAGDPSL